MTASGYPRIVKLWKRGEPLSAARVIYEGQNTRTSACRAWCSTIPPPPSSWVQRDVSFLYRRISRHRGPDGTTWQLPLPLGADLKGGTGP